MKDSDFIAKIAAYAVADMQDTFIPASLTIAQAALESAWGASGLTSKANNLFGIKGTGPAGSVTMPTTEYVNE
ncbi:glucosaminidase domain-containing protein [Paenibacillus bouchesdurhonensis]|uniref:glucosaminidase domain-containing protein n=1 Tax=Paenibacillus bouchesdurhonensis TaxID=1870990 RepID=UPI000FB12DA5|nr:glucosaminidase domain-containing protein [Paenibacillus bouchesdurhonensis]